MEESFLSAKGRRPDRRHEDVLVLLCFLVGKEEMQRNRKADACIFFQLKEIQSTIQDVQVLRFKAETTKVAQIDYTDSTPFLLMGSHFHLIEFRRRGEQDGEKNCHVLTFCSGVTVCGFSGGMQVVVGSAACGVLKRRTAVPFS